MNTEKHWYFAWTPRRPPSAGASKQAVMRDLKWQSGQTVTIAFLDGPAELHDRVLMFAREWTRDDRALLYFEKRLLNPRSQTPDIRISFARPGRWSAVGTSCTHIPREQPTMNLEGIDAKTDDREFRGVVLHEFGHALGLIHEHQIPDNGIQWNREAVIEDVGKHSGWTLKDIEKNILNITEKKDVDYTAFDPNSIMIYPIKANWTINKYFVPRNDDLSEGDIRFIRSVYK